MIFTMTFQDPDFIFYQNKKCELEGYPLITYFELHPPMPKFQMRRTSNHRGYVATWEIADNRVYLVQIEGNLEGNIPYNLQNLFPKATEHVFADWISHSLFIRQGKMLGVKAAFNEVFEESLILSVQKGVIVKTSIRKNKL
jgi:hypothetical protein